MGELADAGAAAFSDDGRPVTAPDELVVAIRSRAPGDTVKLTVRTGGRTRTVSMVLQASVD